MIGGFVALGFLGAVAVAFRLSRIERAARRAGPPVVAVWARHAFVSNGGAFQATKAYDRTLTGHGGHMGHDAAMLCPWPRFTLEGTTFDDASGRLTFTYQASETRWRIIYVRLARQRPIVGLWVPLGDIPNGRTAS